MGQHLPFVDQGQHGRHMFRCPSSVSEGQVPPAQYVNPDPFIAMANEAAMNRAQLLKAHADSLGVDERATCPDASPNLPMARNLLDRIRSCPVRLLC